ncbi:histone-like nucleoid-structuring protein Lsr2 [Streptomyces sp. W1SF4]|uniref:Lsr2 family DNA-binding protein n=1 Tax=Streptomyces sp. W1SF4 TaxID=2305220 RepID=UPI001F49B59F|nr:histone-like nucleoid-structuring protein Lsr2 [Streptomyces sp. W1SF4]
MTGLTTLIRLCPPPPPALRIAWQPVESALGMALPADYKQLAELYGPGVFCEFVHVHHPHGVTPFVNLTGPMPARIRSDLRNDVAEGIFPVPHDPDRLFAVGGTDNGERIFWITDPVDEPDRWHIAVNEARGPRWFTFSGSLTEFLGSVFTGRTSVPQFPRGLLDEAPAFTGSRPVLWKPAPIAESAPVDTASIRAWARANGHDVPARGRIPAEIRRAWEQAVS